MNHVLQAMLIGALCGLPFAIIGGFLVRRILRRP